MLPNIIRLFILLCFVFTGCGKKAKPVNPPPAVTVAEIQRQDVPVYFDSIGLAVPTSVVPVRPLVGGKLIMTYVKEGDEVEQGQLLYTVDPRPFQDALVQAEANLTKDEALLKYAKKTEERYKSVVEEDYISKLSFEQFQTNTSSAAAQITFDQAAIAEAKLNLEFCDIVAPIAGKISYFNVYVGNIVVASDTNAITTIRPFSPIDISFSLPQTQFELVRQAQGNTKDWDFIANLPEDPKTIYAGKTTFIDNQLDQDTGTILIKGRIPNKGRPIWPGAFLNVKVMQRMAKQALTVPPGAVLVGKDGPYLYTLDKDNKVWPQNVTVITRNEGYIAIESDKLHPGDKVISDGQINIAPGMLVKAKET